MSSLCLCVGAIPSVDATFRKSSLGRPFCVPPNVSATNLERFLAPKCVNGPKCLHIRKLEMQFPMQT